MRTLQLGKFLIACAVAAVSPVTWAEDADGTPAEVLEKEHGAVNIVMNAAARAADSIEAGDPVDVRRVEKILTFSQNFIDRCHHLKEEAYYFPALRQDAPPEQVALLDALRLDHAKGRVTLAALEESLTAYRDGAAGAERQIAKHLQDYADSLRQHADREDTVLFDWAADQLTEQQKKEILEGFQRIEAKVLGPGAHEKYHAIAMELKNPQ